jgi:hypothetical protein
MTGELRVSQVPAPVATTARPTRKELFAHAEQLKTLLMTFATGGGADADEYRELRQTVLADPDLKMRMPQFIVTCRELGDFWDFIKGEFSHYWERRQYLRDQFEPALVWLEDHSELPSDGAVTAALAIVDCAHVTDAWRKAADRRATDPEGAITAARALLESVCKHILDETGGRYESSADLPKLYRLASRQLQMAPSQAADDATRRVLGGCHSIMDGVAALRNRLGDSHGKGKGDAGAAARHAELAVNVSGALATFLLATHEAQQADTYPAVVAAVDGLDDVPFSVFEIDSSTSLIDTPIPYDWPGRVDESIT